MTTPKRDQRDTRGGISLLILLIVLLMTAVTLRYTNTVSHSGYRGNTAVPLEVWFTIFIIGAFIVGMAIWLTRRMR